MAEVNTHADGVEMSHGRLTAVLTTHVRAGRRLRFPAKVFADCTGDATIGFKAGACAQGLHSYLKNIHYLKIENRLAIFFVFR